MATERQKNAMAIKIERRLKKEPIVMGKVMCEAGYSKETSKAPTRNLISKKGWRELLAQIKEKPLLDKLREIALAPKDKRANIEAIKELFKLKDRYPAGKLKLLSFGSAVMVYPLFLFGGRI